MSGAVAIVPDGNGGTKWVRVPRIGTLDCEYEPEEGELPPPHWHFQPGQTATLVDDEETFWPVTILEADLEAWEADVRLESGLTMTVEIERVTSEEIMAACDRLEAAWDRVCESGSYLIRAGLSHAECDELVAYLEAEMTALEQFLGGEPIWTSWPGNRYFLTEQLATNLLAYRERLPKVKQLTLLEGEVPLDSRGKPVIKPAKSKVIALPPAPAPVPKAEQISFLAAL